MIGYIASPLSREELFGTNDFLPVILAVLIFTIAPPFRFTRRATTAESRFAGPMDQIGREETLDMGRAPEQNRTNEKPPGSV